MTEHVGGQMRRSLAGNARRGVISIASRYSDQQEILVTRSTNRTSPKAQQQAITDYNVLKRGPTGIIPIGTIDIRRKWAE